MSDFNLQNEAKRIIHQAEQHDGIPKANESLSLDKLLLSPQDFQKLQQDLIKAYQQDFSMDKIKKGTLPDLAFGADGSIHSYDRQNNQMAPTDHFDGIPGTDLQPKANKPINIGDPMPFSTTSDTWDPMPYSNPPKNTIYQ